MLRANMTQETDAKMKVEVHQDTANVRHLAAPFIGRDIHAANLIAVGDAPCAIDLQMLLQTHGTACPLLATGSSAPSSPL